jgi:hypothetical protein
MKRLDILSGFSTGELKLSREEEIAFRKIVGLGLVDQVVRRATAVECRQLGYAYNDTKTTRVPYYDLATGTLLLIHPSSSTSKTHPPPDYALYCVLQRMKRGKEEEAVAEQKGEIPIRPNRNQNLSGGPGGKDRPQLLRPTTFMRGVTLVTRAWLDEIGFDEEALDRLRRTGTSATTSREE